MVDRITLLSEIAPRVTLGVASATSLHKKLEDALKILVVELALGAARELPKPAIDDLKAAMNTLLDLANLKKLSKRWDPARPIDSDVALTDLRRQLIDLLENERPLYVECSLGLSEAQELSGDRLVLLRRTICELAPKTHLKRLVKKWDKHNDAAALYSRSQQAQHLIVLLDGSVEPAPKPPRR